MPNNGDPDSSAIGNQLPLHLPVEAGSNHADFVVTGSNARVTEFLWSWPQWQGTLVILVGPVGSGKSHLAKIWASQSSAVLINASDLVDSQPVDLGRHNVIIENVGASPVSGAPPLDEVKLFHLINTLREHNKSALFLSRQWPQAWGLQLADLSSRLRTATVQELPEPDDELLRSVLMKLFSDRQLSVDVAVINYLALRMERSIGAAEQIVNFIDTQAMARKCKPGRALAAEALDAAATGQI